MLPGTVQFLPEGGKPEAERAWVKGSRSDSDAAFGCRSSHDVLNENVSGFKLKAGPVLQRIPSNSYRRSISKCHLFFLRVPRKVVLNDRS